jgi:arylsulfatase A-like enzyme
MKSIALFLLIAFSCMLQTATAQQNIIFIIADDLGADYCGFYETAVDTANMPNIRSLLPRGVRFRNAWATPLCSTTRAGLLTGRYSFRTGVGTVISGPTTPQLDTAEITIPKVLKANADYTTANIGKWHLNQQTPQNLIYPNRMGYDHYAGNFLGEISNYYDWKKVVDGVSISPNITNYATTETVDDAIDWLGSLEADRPFFLWLAFNAPHTPFHLPPSDLHTVPGLTGTPGHIAQNPKLYFRAMIESMDTEAGRIFTWLKQNNQWENTNIVFIGDNGNTKRVAQNGDTSHVKGTLYQFGVQVPFIISGPAVVQPGRVSDALVSTPDLFATSLEMAGITDWPADIPAGKPVDSKSLLPILKNEQPEVRDWTFTELFNPTPDPKDGKTIRNLDYKLIRFDDGHQEFYHLATDPDEQSDLLLNLPLSQVEVANYSYLCTQLNLLTGIDACDEAVPVLEISDNSRLIRIYPNPADEQLHVVGATAAGQFWVRDIIGRSVLSGYFETGAFELNLALIPPGVYCLELKQTAGVFQGKFIKH